ncbi:phosphoribosyltransferase family protein [Saxibacter everestensis]|uniref:Phosphoribosyltransferase family protein n=1 Tax=Saxibacter everestensis TaxID=2909229 RepID=A0ABY8QSW9_9MICO|nr:phosphoribosyltransferase family protein [Brevibacteriaceae bacterium ZFBP1038]
MTPAQFSTLRQRMTEVYRPISDRTVDYEYLNLQAWWADPEILGSIGAALARPFLDRAPSFVIGPPSSGYLLGALTAAALGVGFAAVAKEQPDTVDSDKWLMATAPPDYRDRQLSLGLRAGTVRPGDRVLAVDDVAETGSQLMTLRRIVEAAGATWLGASVVLDLLDRHQLRRDLNLQTIFHGREL